MSRFTHPIDLPGIEPSKVVVLSIDDNVLGLRAHRALLERAAGITNVVTTSDPFAGLEHAFDEPRPDLAIVNGLMPGMDGPTLIAEIRRREAERGLRHLPVAISSGAGVAHEAGLAAGADTTLEMPVEVSELLGLLLRFLAHPASTDHPRADPDMRDPDEVAAWLDHWLVDWIEHEARARSLEDPHAVILEEAWGHAARMRVTACLRHAGAFGLLPPFCVDRLEIERQPEQLRAAVAIVFGALVERVRLTEALGSRRAVAVAARRHATALESALRFGTGGRAHLRALATAAAADGFLSAREWVLINRHDHEAALRLVRRLGAGWTASH